MNGNVPALIVQDAESTYVVPTIHILPSSHDNIETFSEVNRDLSFSMYVESQDEIHTASHVTPNGKRHFSTIERRQRKKWVDNNSVTKCSNCDFKFGLPILGNILARPFGKGMHHCRQCGNVFCDKCSSKRAIIPMYINVPIPDKGYEKEPIHTVPTRVCDADFEKLAEIKILEKYIIIFSLLDLDIYDFLAIKKATSCICGGAISTSESSSSLSDDEYKLFKEKVVDNEKKRKQCTCSNVNMRMIYQTANYHLSRIFEMQYYLPNHKYSDYDRKILWANRNHFVGHSKWMVQLLRSINFETNDGVNKIAEAKRLMLLHLHYNQKLNGISEALNLRKSKCWDLMCTRDCYHGFLPSDAVQMLNDVAVPELRKIVVDCLESCDDKELLCYLQLLTHYIASEKNVRLDEAVLGNFLIRKSTTNLSIANEMYWLLKININNSGGTSGSGGSGGSSGKNVHTFKYFLEQWNMHVPSSFKEIVFNAEKVVTTLEKEGSKDHRFGLVDSYKKILSKYDKIVYPTNPEKGLVKIDHNGIVVKPSITRPVVIPSVVLNGGERLRMLHKNEDVRKDKIMMDCIRLMNVILTKELDLDLNIVTYNILPLSGKSGLIEMVDRSDTLASITKKGQSLLNYALENNENVVVMDLRQKFVRSCASYCVITFLLGIGDRHLDNIMITKDGQLFHIDYGFVLGYDPKPIEIPMMRISSEMINALGGVDSKYFAEFKMLCQQIYSCLRRHVNLFYSILNLLVELDPPVQNSEPFNERKLVAEIMKRFIPGEGNKEAKVQLDTRITDSTQSYRFALIDWFHHHAQENTAVKSVSEFISKLYKLL